MIALGWMMLVWPMIALGWMPEQSDLRASA
jgi:hypothetical protein